MSRNSVEITPENLDQQIRGMIATLKNNAEIRLNALEDPQYLLGFARKGKWGYVHAILLMFRDMLDRNPDDCLATFPGPGVSDNPFYTPERSPALTAFTNKFREPIIFLLKSSIADSRYHIFYIAFAVLKANPYWFAADILLDSENRHLLNTLIDKLPENTIRRKFQFIFNNATRIELLLKTVDESQRKKICEECVEHIRHVLLFKEHDYFRKIDKSLFPDFIIENFSVVLAKKAVDEYRLEKQASGCCCQSFFFSWKSSGSKAIFYAMNEISQNCYFLFYGDMAHQLYHPGYTFFGDMIDSSRHRHEVRAASKHAHELLFNALAEHGSGIGSHLYKILCKYQLIDDDKTPSKTLFSELRARKSAVFSNLSQK